MPKKKPIGNNPICKEFGHRYKIIEQSMFGIKYKCTRCHNEITT